MSWAEWVAHLVVRRPKTLIAVTVLIVGASTWIMSAHQRFDSEVLNLLPKGSPEVQGLKVFNADFRQGTELIFALKGDPEVLADFEEEFVQALQAEPWVRRVFAASPMESPDEIAALQNLVPQLLLNLPDENFAEVIAGLKPEALRARVDRLKAEIESGSPRADLETTVDPTGLISKAMRPMAGTFGMEKGQSIASEDGTLRLIPVVTNQASLGQADCRATMAQVEAFKQRVLTASPGPKPRDPRDGAHGLRRADCLEHGAGYFAHLDHLLRHRHRALLRRLQAADATDRNDDHPRVELLRGLCDWLSALR